MSAVQLRSKASNQLPIKLKGYKIYFLVDLKGELKNPALFDATVGLKRILKWKKIKILNEIQIRRRRNKQVITLFFELPSLLFYVNFAVVIYIINPYGALHKSSEFPLSLDSFGNVVVANVNPHYWMNRLGSHRIRV